MRFPDLIEARLIRRYQRFLSDFELADGTLVTAHCANPGSMKSILDQAGVRGWLSRAAPGRKLAYRWEVAVFGPSEHPTRCYVNPVGANRVVADALERRAIAGLEHYDVIQSEVRVGSHSRIDFLLTGRAGRAYVEVKNVTLHEGCGRGAFPDSVSTRATKHLYELRDLVRQGHRSVLLFCAARTDIDHVAAARAIDPTYASALSEVAEEGVEILAYTGPLTREGFWLERALPVVLD